MPVVLPLLPWSVPARAPRRIVWLVLFFVIMVIGVTWTLLTWPKGTATNTVWFWVRLLLFPALAWAGLWGLRLLYFEQETDRQTAEHAQWEEERTEAIRFAQEPLAVLGSVYLCAFGGKDASSHIAEGEKKIESLKPREDSSAVRHTVLPDAKVPLLASRYMACFEELLNQLDEVFLALPPGFPLEVYVQFPDGRDQSGLLDIWQASWSKFRYRPIQAVPLSPQDGIMFTDAWLDARGGPALEKFVLFVTAQLYTAPPANSAEAVAGLLLGWAPLVQRKALSARALWHRPVEIAESTLHDTLETALLWGNAQATQVGDIWHAGLARSEKAALLKAATDLQLAIPQTDSPPVEHDIDAALGNPGVATEWLSAALAIERAVQAGSAQIVACDQHKPRLIVIQPPASSPQKSGPQE